MKISKKIIYLISGIFAIGAIGFGALGYKITHPFKPSFFNYKSYISEKNEEYLNRFFQYKVFDEINEFGKALTNNKAAAGIGSDFQAVNLIKEGLITKIDYSVLLDDSSLRSYNDVKSALKSLYRKEIWDHLESYNKYLIDQNQKPLLSNWTDGVHPTEFWEYFVPYYSQDAIVGYNVTKVSIKPENKKINSEEIDFDSLSNQAKYGQENTHNLVNILKTLKANGFNHLTITDAIRDNMLYGSSYWKLPNGNRISDKFTGDVTDKTYPELLKYFNDLIFDSMGYSLKDYNHISLKGDSLEIIRNVLNPDYKDYAAAIMYNGDAMNAYYGSEHFPELKKDGQIRGIKPKHNILLIDGLVVAKNGSEESKKNYLKVLSNSVYENLKNKYQIIKQLKTENKNNLLNNEKVLNEYLYLKDWENLKKIELESFNLTNEQIEDFINLVSPLIDLTNFDNFSKLEEFYETRKKYQLFVEGKTSESVNINDRISYLPGLVQNYLLNNKFDLIDAILKEEFEPKDNFELVLKRLIDQYQITHNIVNLENKTKNEKALILARVIVALQLQNELVSDRNYYIDNFNYVRYVPVENSLYELVLRNYFLDFENGQNETVIKIYEIINNNNNIHKALAPISKKLQSKINIEYFNLTKS
ncbi:type 2 periplasmic-binding domain-containing protein [Mycoplasmopsis glycophila]|uniref:Uncharacterized protein n=1 Tax=Mycoplasmopsis glycophila TaxID=171285 RepID=A0A449AV19_9BACT|nr:hypothetical protein [Mycoplasmopsis glycophila]VEU70374.1 Uncharacterised protein [Mycoplasmopsis glycophila]